jgi:homoserine O-acetyltransferase
VAYETWGELNAARDNAIFVCAGISASSHVRSNAGNPEHGWWEEVVGPGLAIDTNRFFVLSANWLGSCFGTTGPASVNPRTGKRYGLEFPSLTLHDLGRSVMRLLDGLGIERLLASVGNSLGGMVVLAMGVDFPARAGRIASISATGWTRPGARAIRYLQRACVLLDPAFQDGQYDPTRPLKGLSVARQIGFTTYRSASEWNERFDDRGEASQGQFGVDTLVERYLDAQGTRFAEHYDPCTYLYLSKAMDIFDLRGREGGGREGTLREGLNNLRYPTLVVGVDSDLLMTFNEQKEIADAVAGKNPANRWLLLSSLYGHDAFLKEPAQFSGPIREFLA